MVHPWQYDTSSGIECRSFAPSSGTAPPAEAAWPGHDRFDLHPQVSPDGRLVVFSGRVREGPEETASGIFVAGIDGTGLRRVTDSYADEGAPVVSPTGRQIVFECANYMRKGIEYSNDHICSIRPDGSHRFVRIRLDDPKHPQPLGEQFLGRAPVWAPAG